MMRSKRGLCQVNILANATIANAQGQPNQYPNVNVNQNYSHRSSTMDDKCNWQRDVGSKGGIQSFKSGKSIQKMIFLKDLLLREACGYRKDDFLGNFQVSLDPPSNIILWIENYLPPPILEFSKINHLFW